MAVIVTTIARASTISGTLASDVATTWTAAMKVAPGANSRRPVAKAIRGDGRAISLAMNPGRRCLSGTGSGRLRTV
jgi:hypothetical protein